MKRTTTILVMVAAMIGSARLRAQRPVDPPASPASPIPTGSTFAIDSTTIAKPAATPATTAQPDSTTAQPDGLPSIRTVAGQRVLPINLPTAMQLAGVRPIDVQIAGKQVEASAARFARSRATVFPTLHVGGDYFHHDGGVQNFQGEVLRASRTGVMAGFGAGAVWGASDAIFAPLAARQDLSADRARYRAAVHNTATAVAEAYFDVQQARGLQSAAAVLVREIDEVSRKTSQLAEGLLPSVEADRARVEAARRRQVLASANERLRICSAELARLLRLDPAALFDPIEPPNMPVQLIDTRYTLDELIPIALTTRPELQADQAVVQATLKRLQAEKIRPLVPSLLIRSVSTNPSGTLGYGSFGGGPGSKVGSFGSRFDYDVQLVWEFQNLGLGNKARADERRAEHESAILELFRTQDRIAAETARSFAEAVSAAERMAEAIPARAIAAESLRKNIEGMSQTQRTGNLITLIVRPQEVLAAIQAMAQADQDYFTSVADYNRAQFRLYRALGHPSTCLADLVAPATLGLPR